MEKLDVKETAEKLAAALKKPVVFLSFPDIDWEGIEYADILKAAPYLDSDEDMQMIADGYGIVVCKDQDEMRRIYTLTVGDDGPTELNDYDGPSRVYALTVDETGQSLNENT